MTTAEARDRIRREAFKLLQHPEARLEGTVFTTRRMRNGLGSTLSFPVQLDPARCRDRDATEVVNEAIFLQLVAILESDVSGG